MKKLIYLPLLVASLLMGCSATNKVSMSVMEPAPVQLPPYMEHIGIIDRSQSEEKSERNRVLDKIDQILSAEGTALDREGALAATTGLHEELIKADRFADITSLEGERTGNPGFGVFPSPVSWDRIDEICAEHQLDGLFSLEFYDTDTKIDYSTQKVSIKGPLGIEVPALEHHATVTTVIKTGWRIYDNRGRNIVDEFVITDGVTTVGRGINPLEAVSAITGRKEAVTQISTEIGRSYGVSILPYWVRVQRDYYVKGNKNFEVAKRRAQTGNWEGAAELWMQETSNPDPKIAGRASYNMAIISEINGEINEAIEWAQKSYEDYNNKLALEYLNILKSRRAKMRVLERQQAR